MTGAVPPIMLERLVHQAAEAIVVCDVRGRIVLANRAARHLARVGIDAELRDQPPERWAVAYENRRRLDARDGPFADALRGVSSLNRELHLLCHDGSRCDVMVNANPVRDDDGTVVAAMATFTDITARKRVEDDLRRSEALFRGVFSNAAVAIALVDEHGRYTRCNDAWPRMLDLSRDEVLARSNIELTHPEDREATRVKFAALVRGEIDRFRMEKRYIRKDGSILWGDLAAAPIRDADGRFQASIGVIQDITARKKAKQALRQKAAELESLMAAVPAAVLVAEDTRCHRIWGNRLAYEMFRQRPGSNLSQTAGSDRPGNFRLYRDGVEMTGHELPMQMAASRNIASHNLEEEVRFSDGSARHLFGNVIPLRDARDRPIGAIAALLDISDRKAMEQALREKTLALEQALSQNMAELQAVMDAVPAVVLVAEDPQARRIGGNRAAYELLRMPVGANLSLTAPEAERPTHFTVLHNGVPLKEGELPLQRAVRGEEIWNFDEELRFADGTVHYQIGTAVPLRDGAGVIQGAVSAYMDITERKRAEQMLAQAKAEAERATVAKSRFLAAASHDLRQPMQAQILFHDLLSRRLADPGSKGLLQKLGQSLQAQQHMLNALLDVSRLDAGVIQVDRTGFPIGPLIARLAQEYAVHPADPRITVRAVASRALVYSDPTLLEQILRNLVENAVKYTEHGRVLIGCRRRGDRLQVQVWDTGIGIPQDQFRAVFEEFHQLDNPARDRNKGLGLGLAIVKRLADLLDHPVQVRSRVGHGTMFAIDLPPAVRLAAGPDAGEEPARRGRGLIALIEDDRDLLDAVSGFLYADGHELAAAPSVEAVMTELAHGRRCPDLIVADYRLEHGRTGAEAIEALRARCGRAIPGIILTGDTSPDRLKEAAASGFRLLHKPILPAALLRAVQDALEPVELAAGE